MKCIITLRFPEKGQVKIDLSALNNVLSGKESAISPVGSFSADEKVHPIFCMISSKTRDPVVVDGDAHLLVNNNSITLIIIIDQR